MPKKRERSSDEFFRSQLRELSAENKRLKRKIRELEKQNLYSQDEETVTDTEDTFPKMDLRYCPKCSHGKLKVFSVVGRTFEECSECDYRKKLNDGSKT